MDSHEGLVANVREITRDESSHGDSIELDPALPGIRAAGVAVKLTRTEFRLVEYIAAQEPRWVKANELLDNVLPPQVTRDTTLVRVHMLNIRRKLGELRGFLSTERRFGTRLQRRLPGARR